MKIYGWDTKHFHCDECDGEIGYDEEYVQFNGMNYCKDCFDSHKHDVDYEDNDVMCEACGEIIREGYFYRFEDLIYCEECVEDSINLTTESDFIDGVLIDKGYEDM